MTARLTKTAIGAKAARRTNGCPSSATTATKAPLTYHQGPVCQGRLVRRPLRQRLSRRREKRHRHRLCGRNGTRGRHRRLRQQCRHHRLHQCGNGEGWIVHCRRHRNPGQRYGRIRRFLSWRYRWKNLDVHGTELYIQLLQCGFADLSRQRFGGDPRYRRGCDPVCHYQLLLAGRRGGIRCRRISERSVRSRQEQG